MKEKLIYIMCDEFGELNKELENGWRIKDISACTSNHSGRCYVWLQRNNTDDTPA